MKKLTRSALSAAVVAAVSTGGLAMTSTATAEVSVNIGVVSNYFFRGFSETDGGAAVQGGIDFEDASGFYLGTWVSNVDFGPGEATYELDLYGGFAGDTEIGLGYDVGYIYYAYPDAPGSEDFGELYGELSYDMFYGGLAYTINDSSESALESGDLYYYVGVDVPFADVYSAGFLIGRTSFDDSDADNYTHYTASLVRDAGDLGEFSFNLEYEDEFEEDLKAWVGWGISF